MTWRKTKRAVDALFDARLATARERISRIYPATEYSFPGHPYPAQRQPSLWSGRLLFGPDDRRPTSSACSYPAAVNDGADNQALWQEPLSNREANPMHMLDLCAVDLSVGVACQTEQAQVRCVAWRRAVAMRHQSASYLIFASLNSTCLRAIGSYLRKLIFSVWFRGFFFVT